MDRVAVNVGRRGTRSYIFLGISKLGVMKIQRAIEFCGILFVCLFALFLCALWVNMGSQLPLPGLHQLTCLQGESFP